MVAWLQANATRVHDLPGAIDRREKYLGGLAVGKRILDGDPGSAFLTNGKRAPLERLAAWHLSARLQLAAVEDRKCGLIRHVAVQGEDAHVTG